MPRLPMMYLNFMNCLSCSIIEHDADKGVTMLERGIGHAVAGTGKRDNLKRPLTPEEEKAIDRLIIASALIAVLGVTAAVMFAGILK